MGFESSLEFAPVEGDLAREEEARLIEALENAKSEIKNMKTRQAMVINNQLNWRDVKSCRLHSDNVRQAMVID